MAEHSKPYKAFSDSRPDDVPMVRQIFKRIADLKDTLGRDLEDGASIPDNLSDERLSKLRELCLSVEFSPHWQNFVTANAWKAAFTLAGSHPPRTMAASWKGMDADERLEFLSDFSRMQAGLFSDKTLRFTRTAILSGSIKDSGAFSFTADALDDPAQNSITIRDIEHLPYEDAIIYGWHEQLHGLNFQLASAVHRGIIREDHSFYQDGAMLKEKISAFAHISAQYPTRIYRAEVEERLCYSSQDSFYSAYLQNSSQSFLSQAPSPGIR